MDDAARQLRQALAPQLPGIAVEVLPQVDSTNSELMRRARAGQAGAVLLVALYQTAGRGRLGRAWRSATPTAARSTEAPTDSLTFSLGLPLGPTDWSGLSLVVGVAIAEALHPAVQLKWPNDLWVSGRKLGGILVETASLPDDSRRQAVIGVGLNLAPPDAAGLSTPPAALRELLPDCGAVAILTRLAPALVTAVRAFEAGGFLPFRARFEARDALRDCDVRLSDGVQGMACGVSASGALLVHTAAGVRTVTSAEVSVRPLAGSS